MNIINKGCRFKKEAAGSKALLDQLTNGLTQLGKKVENPLLDILRPMAAKLRQGPPGKLQSLGDAIYKRIAKHEVGRALATGNDEFVKTRTGWKALNNKIDEYLPKKYTLMDRVGASARGEELPPFNPKDLVVGPGAALRERSRNIYANLMNDIWAGNITDPNVISDRLGEISQYVPVETKQKILDEAMAVYNKLNGLPFKTKEELNKLRLNLGEAAAGAGILGTGLGVAGAHELSDTFI